MMACLAEILPPAASADVASPATDLDPGGDGEGSTMKSQMEHAKNG